MIFQQGFIVLYFEMQHLIFYTDKKKNPFF